jgi:Ca-activated chloride channel family protein
MTKRMNMGRTRRTGWQRGRVGAGAEGRQNRCNPSPPTRDRQSRSRRTIVPWIMGLGILVFSFLHPTPATAQDARAQVEEGNRLYEEGRFQEAHQKYLEALLSDPESPLIRFNDGNALYQDQDFQRAMERYMEALQSEDPGIRSSAWYNLGNALYRQQKLQESLEAYKQSLRADPRDVDAKHNLERVLQQLQQQEQQQQNQGGENQEGQDQQQQEDQQQQQGQNQDQEQQQQQEGQGRNQQQQGQDQEQDQEGQQQQSQQPDQSQAGEGEAQRRPGEMTQEEAERLLGAIQEDPGEVNRRRAPATGKRPRKKW